MIEPLIACTTILLLAYALLIYYYHRIWDRIPVSSPDLSCQPVRVSVIIPARNEAAHIENCLLSLFNQSYPPAYTDILVVNDFSTDESAEVVMKYSDKCRLLNLADFLTDPVNSYKKKAIETGIAHSSSDLIICTDADCTMGKDWILSLVSAYLKENRVFIAAPVKIIPDGSALSVFQTLDFISLQGITGAAVYKNLYPMCNGANLAYSRTAFETVGGFTDIDHIASGDDMLADEKNSICFSRKNRLCKRSARYRQHGISILISGLFSASASDGPARFRITVIRQLFLPWPWYIC